MSLLEYSFFTYSALGVLLTAIATGLIGSYVVVRRMVFIAGGVTHSSFAGLGLGFFLGQSPLLYAMGAAILSGLGVEMISDKGKVRSDSAIAAVWSLGMAIGVLFTFMTPGYTPGLNAFLFGNILLISRLDLIMLGAFLAVSIPAIIYFYNPLLLVSFDPEYGHTRGINVRLYRLALMIWICIGIVLSIRVMGIMMLMSMLTLPQMTVNLFTSDFKKILIFSCILSILSGICALIGSYILNLPTGAFSILLLTIVFVVAKGVRALRQRRLAQA
ncbi:metal ABC transporter permease [Porphyromonas sp.]|uniref:metal ABC transporter permease n=1 Tax=Porphyromonas sp. TaxID=1924944 RepID=UPI0026DD7586|nr:metal ABC transporter permease [Porphyromonas sp.]MDO4771633.1 metal ABC transporter permease [Porphyromonas sp.]